MNGIAIIAIVVAVLAAAGLVCSGLDSWRERQRKRAAAIARHPATLAATAAAAEPEDEIPPEYREWEQDDHLEAAGAWTAFYAAGSLGPYPEQPTRRGRLCTSASARRRLHAAIDALLDEAADSRP